ncbi:MAG TPA: DNA repair protein RecN [Woeseiaceae bacterium]|nr:DNA repair protein RecN [Woeseiaceae bacterium]
MLLGLAVRDFAIVDRIDVEFAAGMSALTGETGAGKSILVDALGLVLGERGSAQLVRPGASRAEFSAEFDLANLPHVRDWLAERSLDDADACLLRRVIGADGRSRAWINGNAVPVQQQKEIGEMLVDIHGQHFHQSLGRRAMQRDLLDHFGGVAAVRSRTEQAFASWQAIEARLRELLDDDAGRAARIDLATFQLGELDALDLGAGEYEELESERHRLQNAGRLGDGVGRALRALYDGDAGNANSLIAEAARALDALSGFDATLAPLAELVESAGIQVNEAAEQLQRYADGIDMDPARRDAVEERLDAIQVIARKHRTTPERLPALREQLAAELRDLEDSTGLAARLETELEKARTAYFAEAENLSAGRRKAAARLSEQVSAAMHGLGMPGGTFAVALETLPDGEARAHGIDEIAFEISANPGQPRQPLSRIASGGELSRMGLAIQVIASDGSAIPTMVFDEVDAGVGGGVAEMVGRRLAELGRTRQVLCVTHLPQVASQADWHYRVAKVSDGKSTRTRVERLEGDERVQELARMLGGVDITETTLAHAAEMLAGAPKKRA